MTEPLSEPVAVRGAPAGAEVAHAHGFGWRRVALAVADAMPAGEIERIWLFPPVQRDEREWGTAVVARRIAEGRLRVYTGRYGLVMRGRARGQGEVVVVDVGETPDAVVPQVVRGVRERAGEADDPVEIAPADWYGSHDQPSAAG